jgi:TolA-binding protein
MKNPTPEKIRARLAARFDRQAIDQLRDELGRLAGRVESLESELLRQIQRADQAENNADFWRDYANDCLGDEGENKNSHQVGITRTGQMVVISGGAA